MKPDRAVIDLSFPHPIYGTFTPVKLHLEYPLAPGETEDDAWDAGKKSMEQWVASRYPDPNPDSKTNSGLITHFNGSANETKSLPIISKEPEERRIGILVADIYSCPDIKTLETYKFLAKTKPELQAAYTQQLEKLSK